MRANRSFLLFGIPVFLMLAAVTAVSYRFAQSERQEQRWIIHTYQVMDAARAVLGDVQEAQSGQRGYLLTHQPAYLAPYMKSRIAAADDIARLRALFADNPRQIGHGRELATLVTQRIDTLGRVLSLFTPQQATDPKLLALLEQGRAQMTAIRTVIAAILAEEESLLKERSQSQRQFENRMITSASVGSLLALAVLLSGALLLLQNNRRLLAAQLQHARQTSVLQATLDSIRDGIAVFDADGTLTAFNQNFFKCMSFPDTMARRGAKLKEFEDYAREHAIPLFEQVITPGGIVDLKQERLGLGERQVDLYRNSVPADGFLIACVDVTERVHSERLLRQSQKMEAVGQLTGGVAHDFNNLLQIISTNLDFLAADVRGMPKAAQRAQNAISAVNRGSRLTNQLLAFARRQALDPRSTNLGRLVQEMTELLRRTLGERIDVESAVGGGLWNTLIDRNQVENAILNLAINARDAMPEGGRLTIEVSNAFLDDAYVAAHSEVAPGQYVMIAISDTGTGMSQELIGKVFEPFFTTKPEGQGTGLGLSQVYGFVKQSNGHIKIYSEPGEGTTVKLYLPRTRKPEEGLPASTTAPVEGGSEMILVVEDDEGVRAAVVDMLAELGYKVLKAGNVDQALAILSSGARIDLLFTDVVMPGAIGTRELARRAQAMQPSILVLFTSGYTQNAIVHNGRLDEDVFLLSKPYRKDELARKIRGLLDARGQTGRSDASDNAMQDHGTGDAGSAPAPKKILVVEDDALIRMSTVDMLAELDLEVAEASDGAGALRLLQSDPAIDLLLTDLGLPGMSGRQLIEEARKLRPSLKVIVASGYSTEVSADSFGEGVLQLAKPYDLGQLRRALGLPA